MPLTKQACIIINKKKPSIVLVELDGTRYSIFQGKWSDLTMWEKFLSKALIMKDIFPGQELYDITKACDSLGVPWRLIDIDHKEIQGLFEKEMDWRDKVKYELMLLINIAVSNRKKILKEVQLMVKYPRLYKYFSKAPVESIKAWKRINTMRETHMVNEIKKYSTEHENIITFVGEAHREVLTKALEGDQFLVTSIPFAVFFEPFLRSLTLREN